MTIQIPFEVDAETEDLAKFQAAGHFVPGLTDKHGFRREWETDEVHILTLRYQGVSPLSQGQQILRVVADTPEAAQELMGQCIRATLNSHWVTSQAQDSTAADWRALNDRINQFTLFIQAHYQREIETGQHKNLATVFDVAVHYMRRERNTLYRRLRRLILRERPAQASDWVPQEWRQ